MLIAISQRHEKNKHGSYVDSLENNYVSYLEMFGIRLIPISSCSSDIEEYFKALPIAGIILAGGNGINPKLYGEEYEDLTASDKRDATEKNLLDIAVKKKLPVLGICRGMEFINVYFGGRLVKVKNHVAVKHKVSFIDKITDESVEVNSYHGVGVSGGSLALNLKPFAVSADGYIEGIYHPNLPVAGIIWHPERPSPDDEINSKIINAFVKREIFWK